MTAAPASVTLRAAAASGGFAAVSSVRVGVVGLVLELISPSAVAG